MNSLINFEELAKGVSNQIEVAIANASVASRYESVDSTDEDGNITSETVEIRDQINISLGSDNTLPIYRKDKGLTYSRFVKVFVNQIKTKLHDAGCHAMCETMSNDELCRALRGSKVILNVKYVATGSARDSGTIATKDEIIYSVDSLINDDLEGLEDLARAKQAKRAIADDNAKHDMKVIVASAKELGISISDATAIYFASRK